MLCKLIQLNKYIDTGYFFFWSKIRLIDEWPTNGNTGILASIQHVPPVELFICRLRNFKFLTTTNNENNETIIKSV